MNRIFADTSYWFSLAVRADVNHERTRDLTLKLQEQGTLIFLSTLVVSEAHRLILYKIGITAVHRFLDQIFLQVGKPEVVPEAIPGQLLFLSGYPSGGRFTATAVTRTLIRRDSPFLEGQFFAKFGFKEGFRERSENL